MRERLTIVVGLGLGVLVTNPSLAEAQCTGSGKNYDCAAGSSDSDVQSAVDSAADGATILFGAGSYTWNGQVTLTNDKGVILLCENVGACTIEVGSSGSVIYMDTIAGQNQKLYRISGFHFQNAPAGSTPIWIYGNGTLENLRIDHNTFENFGNDTIAILLGANGPFCTIHGVLDHNTVTGTDNFMFVKVLGMGDPDAWPPSPKGTGQNLFVEDNQITFTNVQNLGLGCMDIWDSAPIVWRHNQSTNCLVTSHGVIHGGGSINFELYENQLTRTAGSGDAEDGYRLFHHQGSGELIAFNNTFTAVAPVNGDPLGMTHYRSAPPDVAGYDPSLGRCDGTSSIDGNRQPTSTYFGYPCWRQPGRDGAANLQPMYIWNNSWTSGGTKIDMLVEDPWGSTSPGVEDHIVADRDYYNAVSASAQTFPPARSMARLAWASARWPTALRLARPTRSKAAEASDTSRRTTDRTARCIAVRPTTAGRFNTNRSCTRILFRLPVRSIPNVPRSANAKRPRATPPRAHAT